MRRAYEAFAKGDLDMALTFTHPEIEIDERGALPGGRLYQGAEGVREWFSELLERWSDLGLEVREVRTAEDRVLAVVRISAHGASSGASVEGESFHVWQMDGGLAKRFEVFYDRRAALAALAGAD